MKICIIVFIFLLVACSSKNRQCREENVCLFDTILVNHADNDSLLFSFLESDTISLDISLAIETFNLKSKQVKVVVENLENDTLVCVNVIYQMKERNIWVTIPSDFEDIGWIIFPKKKVSSTYGLPYEYDFVVGVYRIIFSFTNSKDEHYDVSAYFEVSHSL